MVSREELKKIIGEMSEDRLGQVEAMLRYQLNPPEMRPEVETMMRRSEEYRDRVQKRFEQSGRPHTCGGGIGSGSGHFSEHEGMAYGSHAVDYWDGRAFVHQTMHYYDGHEIEIMHRLSISEGERLQCEIELSSGGKTVQYADEFPMKRE